jgi:hypothetical protein
MTVTVTGQTQASTSFIGRLLVVLGASDLQTIAIFSTLGLLALIYFAIHLPAAIPLMVQFP